MRSLTALGQKKTKMTRSFLAWLLTWNPRMGEAILLWFALRQANLLLSIDSDPSLRQVFSKTIYKALASDFPLKAWVGFLLTAAVLHAAGLVWDYICGGCASWRLRVAACNVSAICYTWVSFSYYEKGFALNSYSTFWGLTLISLWVAANVYFEHLGEKERQNDLPGPMSRKEDVVL